MGFKDAQWAYRVDDLSFTQTAVLAALALHTDDKTHQTFVGQQTLARELSAAVRTVQRAIAELEAKHVLVRKRRRTGTGYRTTDLVELRVEYAVPESKATESHVTLSPYLGDRESDLRRLSDGAIDHPLVTQENPVTNTRRKSSTPLPDDWEPNDKHREIVLTKTGISLSTEADKFRDWATANDRRYVDWDASFRNWLRNARPQTGRPTGSRPQQPMSKASQNAARYFEIYGPETPTSRAAATIALAPSGTDHDHVPDRNGYCRTCGERAPIDPRDEWKYR